VLWLQSGGCGGCSMSLLCADTTDFHGQLRGAGIDLLWHPSLSLASGDQVTALLDACLDGRVRLDALCIEGAAARAATAPAASTCHGRHRPPDDRLGARLAAKARHVVAVGSCAAWGGVTAGGDNPPTPAACSTTTTARRPARRRFRSRSGGLPVINIAGCPTHPNWVMDTLMALAADSLTNRPGPLAGRASTPTSWCTTAARATSTTNSRPAPKSRPTWAA
jgi:Ni,Fe-hydrogenase I small subunit